MKIQILCAVLFSCNLAQAITFEVIGKNKQVVLNQTVEVDLTQNLGVISILEFNQNKIPFQGSEFGISQLADLGEDIDVISDTEMKAYGWCFSIDGKISETMPDQTRIKTQQAHIQWFYGYAHYKSGDWVGQCLKD